MRHEILQRALAEGAAVDADVATVADATVRALRLLLDELKPLVGELAMQALYLRSVHLARLPPTAVATAEPGSAADRLAALHAELVARDAAGARRAGEALLNALIDLLVALIGQPLTHRLLRTAWSIPAADLPAEDKST